jgi:CheY-like chemotaxis protein
MRASSQSRWCPLAQDRRIAARRTAFDRADPAGRADPVLAGIPVLMLTAKGQAKDRSRAEELGASDFMTKPFSNAEVRDKLRRLVGQP